MPLSSYLSRNHRQGDFPSCDWQPQSGPEPAACRTSSIPFSEQFEVSFRAISLSIFPARSCRKTCAILFLAPTLFSLDTPAFGWVYPEHRGIALYAIQHLNGPEKAALDSLWTIARRGYESRLYTTPADLSGQFPPVTIDYAAWPAIAGDHSCSSANMLQTVLQTDWILKVAAISARLNTALSQAGLERHTRTNAMRDADINLQRVDPEYITRAGANNVHFLLARPYAETDGQMYVETCLANGCESNALGTYAWYHLSALRKAYRLSQGNLPDSVKRSTALAALADEAYALHFLQDVFAAGHVAGTRGDASLRKGTHDYYNEHGLEVRTWEGKSIVLKGDAWMRAEDAERAALAVQASLSQFLETYEGKGMFPAFRSREPLLLTADTLNTCLLDAMPNRDIEAGLGVLLSKIVNTTPVPGLAEGEGELPRFRSEIGPFIGVVPAIRAGALGGGFGKNQKSVGFMSGLDVAIRIGLGLEGVMNESGDGLVALDLGYRLDAASSISIADEAGIQEFGQIFAAIPSRAGLSVRLRVPFYLIPLDLLVAAPFLLPTAPDTYTQMAVVAGNGGLIPWQAGIATSFGRFQFVLGREIGICEYGYLTQERMIIPYGPPGQEDAILADLRSIQLEFPILEYMPFRRFSTDQSSSLVIQLFGAVDIPTGITRVYPPGALNPDLRSPWLLGIRAAFRWRQYL